MKKSIYSIFTAVLLLTSLFANGQSGEMTGTQKQADEMLRAQGQKYNEKDFSQEFVYDLKVDNSNTITGSIIQENKSPDKDWCAYLKVTALDKDKKAIAVFATLPHNLEAQGKEYNAKVFTQNVKWKLNKKCFDLAIECVTSCTPLEGQ